MKRLIEPLAKLVDDGFSRIFESSSGRSSMPTMPSWGERAQGEGQKAGKNSSNNFASGWIVIALLMTGCNSHYQPSDSACCIPDEWQCDVDEGELQCDWWKALDDPNLDALICCARSRNHDIRLARTRVSEWEALRKQARSALLPRVDATTFGTGNKFSENAPFGLGDLLRLGFGGVYESIYFVGATLAWEIDIFGERRATLAAAKARVRAAAEEVEAAQISIGGRVAITYLQLRDQQHQLQLLRERVELLEEKRRLTASRVNAGLDQDRELYRAESELAAVQEGIPLLEGQVRSALYQLAVLTGGLPESLLCLEDVAFTLAPLPQFGVGLRSDLVRRRPDVQAIEQQLISAHHMTRAKCAALFPKFFLLGGSSYLSVDNTLLFNPESRQYTWGGSGMAPIFTGGLLSAQLAEAGCKEDQACVQYEKAVLTALNEAEDALFQYKQNCLAAENTRRSYESAEKALHEVESLYRVGIARKISFVEAQLNVNARLASDGTAQTRTHIAYVRLHNALGF